MSGGSPGARVIDRRQFLRAGGGALVFAAVGCSRRQATASGSSLTIAYPLNSWDFLFRDDSSQFLVFLPLVARGVDGALHPRLAESWEHSADHRSWTVRIRDDVRWHDRVPVTAHDVKFTLDLLSSPEVRFALPGGFTVAVIDDFTYTIEYHHQAADEIGKGSPLDDYTVYYPKHLLEPLDPATYDRWDFWSSPVGNGPYRYVRQMPHTMMEFEANPDHFRGRPRIERLILKFTAGGSDLTELWSGNVEAIAWGDSRELEALSSDPRFRIYHDIGHAHDRVLAWNLRHPAFRDARVRRALTLAIDRLELRRLLSLPEETPIFDVPLSSGQFYRREIPTPLPYDPAAAKRLLSEAGWVGADPDIRSRGGRLLRFTLLAPNHRQAEAVYIQSQLRRVGADANVQMMEWSPVRERVTAGDFEAALFVANASLDSPIGVLPFFGEESFIGYDNREVAGLLDELLNTIAPAEIDRIHRQLERIFEAELPVTYLYPNVESSVASERIQGLSTPFRADLLRYADELWVADRSGIAGRIG